MDWIERGRLVLVLALLEACLSESDPVDTGAGTSTDGSSEGSGGADATSTVSTSGSGGMTSADTSTSSSSMTTSAEAEAEATSDDASTTLGESTSTDTADTGSGPCNCTPNEFCDFPDDQCGNGDLGMCMVKPDACPDVVDPVCGCDGMTYGNECEAHAAGRDIASHGPCGGQMMCLCPFGDFCDFPDDGCGFGQQGMCATIPNFCPEIDDPVCGCDGLIYSNGCYAHAAGVDVDYPGPCGG